MAWAAIGVGAVSLVGSGIKYFKGRSDDKKAQAEAAKNQRPFERVQDEYFQNQNLAREQATSGLPIDVKNRIQTQRDRGLSSSLDAAKQAGGSPNDFARLNDVYDESLKNESAEDAQQHFANLQYLMGVNKDIAGQKQTQWGVNEYQPFESKLQEIQNRRIAAQTNQNNAIDEGIGTLGAIGTAVGGLKKNSGGTGNLVDESHANDPSWYGSDAISGPSGSDSGGGDGGISSSTGDTGD